MRGDNAAGNGVATRALDRPRGPHATLRLSHADAGLPARRTRLMVTRGGCRMEPRCRPRSPTAAVASCCEHGAGTRTCPCARLPLPCDTPAEPRGSSPALRTGVGQPRLRGLPYPAQLAKPRRAGRPRAIRTSPVEGEALAVVALLSLELDEVGRRDRRCLGGAMPGSARSGAGRVGGLRAPAASRERRLTEARRRRRKPKRSGIPGFVGLIGLPQISFSPWRHVSGASETWRAARRSWCHQRL